MIAQEKKSPMIHNRFTISDFVISEYANVGSSLSWIIRDRSAEDDQTDIAKYFYKLCALFAEQIKEFEALKRKATKQEQKQLQTLLALTLEAQELLYDGEENV